MKVAKRGQVPPFRVMEVFRDAHAHAESGADVFHLSAGQPGCEAPEPVRQKAAKLLLEGAPLGYTDARGIAPLRQRIAQYYQETYGFHVPSERIAITVGSSSAFLLALLSAFEAGDKVAIAHPCYPAYPRMLEALGLQPVYMRASKATHFQPTLAMLQALPGKPDGIIIASPSNPTGTVIDAGELRAITAYCDATGIRLISDEIYHGVTYTESKTVSAAGLSPHAIVINSFSKYFLMPGWRLGWAVVPEELLRSFESLLQNFFISPSALSQHAAVEVFNCKGTLDEVVAGYARNRAIMLDALPRAGFDDLSPSEGAFYIYANVSKLTNDSAEFCRKMLLETGVSAVPGYDFDPEQGASFIRFSFAGKESDVRRAMERLQGWLHPHNKR